MPKFHRQVHCIDFNSQQEVSNFLRYMKNTGAKIGAYDQKKPNFNTFGIITQYREKPKKEEK